ncbi:hypothetical protein HU175_16280 [Spirosoma sp. KUDC1026]|nr:hypothetical protein HU175_16280 [Spirosoma sp. KUDC1026]
MRSLVSYILLVATLLPLVSPWGTIAYYQLNRDYIARVLCENRDRPELHCNGQCFLAKRLKAQQDKQDKETTERVQNTPSIQLYAESVTSFTFAPAVRQLSTTGLFTYLIARTSQSLDGLFRPPRA